MHQKVTIPKYIPFIIAIYKITLPLASLGTRPCDHR